jgi:hypothetical protein
MMVSFWWVLAAFVAGGSGGILAMALMCMAGRQSEQPVSGGRGRTKHEETKWKISLQA